MGEQSTTNGEKIFFSMPDRQWKYLLDRLQEEEALLFIGPGILPFPGYASLEDALCQYLLKRSEEERKPFIQKFYRDDKFFMLDERQKHKSLWNFMSYYSDFFTEHDEQLNEARQVLRKLAEIPFSTIITLSPNILLEEAFGDDLPFHSDFYNKKQKPAPYIPGRKEDPLIYYMRGKMTVDESMVISHNDLFDYLESIYEANSMDNEFKKYLSNSKYYVFLGLPLESWYMQLLMRLFQFHVELPQIMALKKFGERYRERKELYEDLYQVEFHDSDSIDFINQVHARCDQAGMLRSGGERAANSDFVRDADRLQALLREGQHEESLAFLEELTEKYLGTTGYDEYRNDLMLGVGNYRSASRDFNTGRITYDKFKVEEVRLMSFLNMQFKSLKALVDEQ